MNLTADQQQGVVYGRDDIKSSLRWHTRFIHGYDMPWHQQVWAEALQDMTIPRLLIIAPPKFGKSPVIGLDYLGWRIGNDPEHYHCIYVSNTATQAQKNSVALRDTVRYNRNYQWLYDVKPDSGKGWGESEWYVWRSNQSDKDPTIQAVGIGGPILGATVEEIIFDDVADQENMATEYQREKLMDWIRTTAMSRLVPGYTRAVMICTRWHEMDPAAVFEKEGWVVIEIPAVENLEIGERGGLPCIVSGEPTYPEFWTLKALGERLKDLLVHKFQMMFQGNIMPQEGAIFKHEWWRYWVQGEAPWQRAIDQLPILGKVQVWDTAFKERKENDFSVCETWYIVKNGYYLVDVWKAQCSFPDLKRVANTLYDQHKPNVVLIEDAASGQDLIAELRHDTVIPVIPVKADRDKVSRANAATPTVAAGKVFVPRDAPWLKTWEYEHEVFPRGKHDDQVDTTVHFLNWVRTSMVEGEFGMSGVEKKSTWKGDGDE